ncbi:cytochrome c1, heme protein, mitochondrial isoform X2 [Bemisia tabaci]|uniref:cytochrome c1, heme protein, mitochondrial isoform X2 n=1 Tax=Bemisia tabaci TaxID=7038 RepID=UPI003B28B8B8
MAAAVGRISASRLLKTNSSLAPFQLWTSIGVVAGGAGALFLALETSVKATDIELHPPKLPWDHKKILGGYDHRSVRRGWEVYKNVCAACHSMRYLCYRDLVGATHTEAEAKAEAEEQMIEDGPNDVGEMFKRPGKLSDHVPSPYPNEEAARAANGGAYPPDLSYIIPARHGGEDYVFHLLTGYHEPPAGVALREGLHYNPYFVGGAIGMAQALYSEIIEYEDGTPATQSQLAKDVTNFLAWAAFPELEERKQVGIKSIALLSILLFATLYLKRFRFSVMKTRKIQYNPPKKDV